MNATTLNMQVSAVQSSWNHRWQTALHHDLNEPILRSAKRQLFRCRRKVLAGHSRITARLGQFSWRLTILIVNRAEGSEPKELAGQLFTGKPCNLNRDSAARPQLPLLQ